MKNLLLIIFTALSFSVTSEELHEMDFEEPSHLVPDRSVYAEPFLMDYHLMVSELLPPRENELLRVLVFPSFAPEYSISVREIDGVHYIEGYQPEKSYWGYKTLESKKKGESKILKDGELQTDLEGIERLEREYPDSPSDLTVNDCKKKIGEELLIQISNVWERELFRVRHPQKYWGGFDGAAYHFSMRKGMRVLSGQTWSPSKNLPTGKLVGISNALFEFCFGTGKIRDIKNAVKASQ